MTDVVRPRVVLDTNVLLEWRVFADPRLAPLVLALETRAVEWLACAAMEREWSLVWPRPAFARWQPDPARTASVFEHARPCEAPAFCGLRCKDPQDQVFIDLAVAQQATWLLTRDAALLKLARRARDRHGVQVVPPEAWCAAQGPAADPERTEAAAQSRNSVPKCATQ